MYLFSRRTRLAGGHGRAGTEWAIDMAEKVRQIADLDLSVWASVYSPEFRAISFSAFVPDLTALEAAGDKLLVDDGFVAATDVGAALTAGGLEDLVLEIVHGAPDAAGRPQYVSGVQAICKPGNLARGMELGVEIAQRAEAITGVPTLFAANATGQYGGVGWLSGYADIAGLEAAQKTLAADAEWLAFLDREAGSAYLDDAGSTQTEIFRRLT